jgi:hypothetical protein
MIHDTEMAAAKQPKYQSRQLQELALINSFRMLFTRELFVSVVRTDK